jgi:hypothetical protein
LISQCANVGEAHGLTVDEWKALPEQPGKYSLVGSAVAVSMQGTSFFGTDQPSASKLERISIQDLQ